VEIRPVRSDRFAEQFDLPGHAATQQQLPHFAQLSRIYQLETGQVSKNRDNLDDECVREYQRV